MATWILTEVDPGETIRASHVKEASNDWQGDVDANGNRVLDAGGIQFREVTAPSTPAANLVELYVDTADGALKIKDDGGNVTTLSQAVSSVFGRTGAVVAVEGDYDLTELGDVTLTTPSENEALVLNGASEWVNAAIANSVFGRTGAVVAAASDYDANQIDFTPAGDLSSSDVQAALEELDSEKAASGHTHAIDDLTDVTITTPSTGEVLTFNGSIWANAAPAAVSTPGGSDTQLQFNNGGSFGGLAGITTDDTNLALASSVYIDIEERSAPSAPAAGFRRLFVNTATGKLSVQTEGDSTISLEEAGGGAASPGGDPGEVQINIAGALEGEPAFTWDNTNKTVELARAVDGDHVGLKVINSQANALDSVNESAQIRFGFASDEDVARIVCGKEGDHTTTAASDSYLGLWVHVNDTAAERARLHQAGLDLTAGYLQLDEIAAPSTPSSDKARIFVDQTDGLIKAIKDSGSIVGIETSSSALMITPEDHGAVGDGSTDDTVAFQAAIDAVDGTGGTLWASKQYKITADLDITTGDFTIAGGGTILPEASSGTIICLNIVGGTSTSTGSATTIARSAAMAGPAASIDFDSVSGFSVGDYVRLSHSEDSGNRTFAQVSRIAAIVSATVTFTDPVFIPMDAGAADTVLRLTPLSGLKIRDITIDGSLMSGTGQARGLEIRRVVDSEFANLQLVNLTENQSLGLAAFTCANLTFRNILARNCGTTSGGTTSDLWFIEVSNSHFENIRSEISVGFGPQWSQCCNCTFDGVVSNASAGRGIKISGTVWSHAEGLVSNGHAFNGLAITNATYRLQVVNGDFHQNQSLGGIWFSNHENDFNTFVNVRATGNDTADIILNASDSNNVFTNATFGTLSNAGGDNSFQGPFHDTRDRTNVTLSNGANADVASPTPFLRIAGPDSGFSVNSIADPWDGKVVTLYNTTTQDMTLTHNSGGTAGNRLECAHAGASPVITGVGSATFIYDAQSLIWRLLGVSGQSA